MEPSGLTSGASVSSTSVSANQAASLSWNSFPGAISYNLYVTYTPTSGAATIYSLGNTTGLSYRLAGLAGFETVPSVPSVIGDDIDVGGGTLSGSYSFQVVAIGQNGTTSQASNIVNATVSGANNAVTLTWPASTGATSYDIYATEGATTLFQQAPANASYDGNVYYTLTSFSGTAAAAPSGLSTAIQLAVTPQNVPTGLYINGVQESILGITTLTASGDPTGTNIFNINGNGNLGGVVLQGGSGATNYFNVTGGTDTLVGGGGGATNNFTLTNANALVTGGNGQNTYNVTGGNVVLNGAAGPDAFTLNGAGTYTVIGDAATASTNSLILNCDNNGDTVNLAKNGSAAAPITMSGGTFSGIATNIGSVSVFGGTGSDDLNASGMIMRVALDGDPPLPGTETHRIRPSFVSGNRHPCRRRGKQHFILPFGPGRKRL